MAARRFLAILLALVLAWAPGASAVVLAVASQPAAAATPCPSGDCECDKGDASPSCADNGLCSAACGQAPALVTEPVPAPLSHDQARPAQGESAALSLIDDPPPRPPRA